MIHCTVAFLYLASCFLLYYHFIKYMLQGLNSLANVVQYTLRIKWQLETKLWSFRCIIVPSPSPTKIHQSFLGRPLWTLYTSTKALLHMHWLECNLHHKVRVIIIKWLKIQSSHWETKAWKLGYHSSPTVQLRKWWVWVTLSAWP